MVAGGHSPCWAGSNTGAGGGSGAGKSQSLTAQKPTITTIDNTTAITVRFSIKYPRLTLPLFYRIVSARVKRMALKKAFYSHKNSPKNSMFLNGFVCVGRAARNKPATGREMRGNRILIKKNQLEDKPKHNFP
jgi:hypothetical protein